VHVGQGDAYITAGEFLGKLPPGTGTMCSPGARTSLIARRMLAVVQSRMKAMRASAARSTNGSPLTSTAAWWIVPPVKGQGAWPG
jgi:hypothetical protein